VVFAEVSTVVFVVVSAVAVASLVVILSAAKNLLLRLHPPLIAIPYGFFFRWIASSAWS
jgi:hypothetical protein